MVNNVIEVVNCVIAARPSLLNFMIADIPQSHSMEQAVAIMTGALATGETPGDPRERRRSLILVAGENATGPSAVLLPAKHDQGHVIGRCAGSELACLPLDSGDDRTGAQA